MTDTILLATRSEGKLRELRPLFVRSHVRVMDLREVLLEETEDEDLLERFPTFEENALAKARHFHARSGGRPTAADDSGLEVVALGGRPGVRSKRWSGRSDLTGAALDAANNETLLGAVAGMPDRSARYVCVAAYVDGTREIITRGETAGVVLLAPRGTGGFGYDPYFSSTELGRTFGELSLEEKEQVSHRGRAFRALLDATRRERPK
ncbi:MAG: non-canonical purine NTP pyrophosphatase [Gemmatimonadaceae bacterium]